MRETEESGVFNLYAERPQLRWRDGDDELLCGAKGKPVWHGLQFTGGQLDEEWHVPVAANRTALEYPNRGRALPPDPVELGPY